MKQQYTIRMKIAGLALALLLLMTAPDAQAQAPAATVGKEFHVSCLHNSLVYQSYTPSIQIRVVVEKPCRITAKYNNSNSFWNGWNDTPVAAGTYTEPATYADLVNTATGTSSKTLSITATEDIAVYAINFMYASSDAAVILPTSTWGYEYRLATLGKSYHDVNVATYSVVSKENGTTVTLHNGNTVQLNANQVYTFRAAKDEDLTGMKVWATRPVAVYSGHEVVNCPHCSSNQCSADHCYEQLWSTDKWGRDFFVWPVDVGGNQNNWGGEIGIVANEAGTNVSITGGINNTYNNMAAGGKQYVCDRMTGLCRIESNKPIMVFTVLPDASLTWIPPTDQRVPRAPLSPFIMPQGVSNIVNHSVEMLIPKAYWNETEIRENGTVANKGTYEVKEYSAFNDWITVRKVLTTGITKVDVYSKGGLLGYVYGWGNIESYGYVAGAGGRDLRNYFTVQESETSVDTHYENTTEASHTFPHSGNFTVKRTVEKAFDQIIWLINDVQYSITENTAMSNTLNFPTLALLPGENTITMSVRYAGSTNYEDYTGMVWLRSLRSFGDALQSYGMAAHYLSDKLYLGATVWDPSKVQSFPVYSIDANTAQNDNALTLTATNGYTNLSQPGFMLSGNDATSAFTVTNSTAQAANLKGWIDFNRNGVFDAGEASNNISVPAGSSGLRTLTWANATAKLQNGKTYMRLRLSTATIPNENASGTLLDGEVEDYALNLNLIEVNKTVTPTTARMGDELTYNITLKNNSPVILTATAIIDPVPSNTEYVEQSATPTGGLTTGNQSVGGQTVKTVKWTAIPAINAGASSSVYSFKVKISAVPQATNANDSIIANLAYALLNLDSIPSTGAACKLADVTVVSVDAKNDTATTTGNKPVTVDVLANDDYAGCTRDQITVSLSTRSANRPAHGTAVINNNNIVYTPAQDFYGNDSLLYIIEGCAANPRRDSAKVYINVMSMPDNVIDAHCYTTPPVTQWGIKSASVSNSGQVLANVIPLVGDLTGDGIPEIVCWDREYAENMDPGNGYVAVARTILVYDGRDIREPIKRFRLSSGTAVGTLNMSAYEAAPFGLVQTHDGRRLIVVACSDYKLHAYDIMNGMESQYYEVWVSDATYTTANNDNQVAVTVGFADFNQDGYPEIYVRNKIFDAETGRLLASAPDNSNTASSYTQYTTVSHRKLSAPVAADVIGDSKLELILGNEVYRVTIAQRNGTGNGNEIVKERYIPVPTNSIADGHPQVADFNGDGHLDILITVRHDETASSYVSMYVWDVWNGQVGQVLRTQVDAVGKSIPLISDIDGDGKLEILIQMKVSGSDTDFRMYECNPSTLALSTDGWGYNANEDSFSNSVTAFDFNHDGKMEILLTDQEHIKIFDGTEKIAWSEDPSMNPLNTLASFSIKEVTQMQYPIIADVDGDGQAEIVIIGYETGPGTDSKLRIYKSSQANSPWAPARKVWNQYMYNSVNINDDLTVPQNQFNPATRFAGGAQPYNNFLQQQTMLGTNGEPLWLLPDYTGEGYPDARYYVVGDSVVISNICVKNIGDARGEPNLSITLYKDSRSTVNKLQTYVFPAPADTGVNAKVCYKIKYVGVSNHNPVSLFIELNDDGTGHPQRECIMTEASNGIQVPLSSLFEAKNDYMVVFACGSGSVDLLANDLNAAGTVPSVVSRGNYGSTSTTIALNKIFIYDCSVDGCAGDAGKRDIASYKLEKDGKSSMAYIYIDILPKPDIVLRDSCSLHPYLTVVNEYPGATYKWSRSTDGSSNWTEITGKTESRLYVTDTDYYKVEITYKGAKGESPKLHFITVKKRKLSGGAVWYESRSEK